METYGFKSLYGSISFLCETTVKILHVRLVTIDSLCNVPRKLARP